MGTTAQLHYALGFQPLHSALCAFLIGATICLLFYLNLQYQPDSQDLHEQPRMMGLDTGNEAADFEAGIWLMALIGTLAAAVPIAFLNPSLGFKKRSIEEPFNNVLKALEKYGKDL